VAHPTSAQRAVATRLMANHIQHSLDVLELDEHHVKDALHCLLHTIFFNRALGMVQPREVDAEGRLDVYWVECNDPQVEETVRRRVDEYAGSLARQFQAPDQALRPQPVTVKFFETKKISSFFSEKIERNHWEEWIIPLQVHPTRHAHMTDDVEGRLRAARLSQELRDRMRVILEKVDAKKDHLPQVEFPCPSCSCGGVQAYYTGWRVLSSRSDRTVRQAHPARC
jgi:autophagy-related protein 101